MTTLSGEGVTVELPSGWEGSVRARVDDAAVGDDGLALAQTGPAPITMHAANFALPADRGDFGGGAVEVMAASDVFVSLIEFGPQSADTALFAHQGVPRLASSDFDPFMLQRVIHGQVGTQRFFTAGGRAFCLYVVLGRETMRAPLVRQVNAMIDSLRIAEG